MRILVSALFVVSSIAVGAAGQAGAPASQGQQPAAGEQQPAARTPAAPAKMVISGCIQNAPAAAATAGTTGAGAPAAPSAKFVLANAKAAAAAAGAAPVSARYQLDGEEKTVSTHLNHQVEITGTVQPVSLTTPGAGPGGPMLRVESVKMVAEKCS